MVPEFLGSFTSKEHDKILQYQELKMVKKLHKKRPFRGGSWEISEESIPEESRLPQVWEALINLTPKERYAIMIFSGSVSELLGTTVAADADLIVWNPNNYPDLNNIGSEEIDTTTWNGTKYVVKGNVLDYKEQWFNIDYPKLYGANSMEETIFNPAFHFYWKGLKFISLDAVIARLKQRARPSGYVDLLMLEKIGITIGAPIQVPNTAIAQGKNYDYTTSSGQIQLLKTIQYYLKLWHNQNVSMQELQKKLILPQRVGGFKSSHSLDTMFPEKEGVDYSKLKQTPEGEYSITKRVDGKRLLLRMKQIVGSTETKHITDLTGNVGGDTILFGLNFKKVDSIEYNQENFDALKHNVETYKLDNVKVHFGDSTKLYNWYTDVLYIDAPWGGPDYKEKENLDLFLGDVRIDLFIKHVLEQSWRPKYIFLKLPRNYNFERLETLEKVKKAHKFPIRGFNAVGLEII